MCRWRRLFSVEVVALFLLTVALLLGSADAVWSSDFPNADCVTANCASCFIIGDLGQACRIMQCSNQQEFDYMACTLVEDPSGCDQEEECNIYGCQDCYAEPASCDSILDDCAFLRTAPQFRTVAVCDSLLCASAEPEN